MASPVDLCTCICEDEDHYHEIEESSGPYCGMLGRYWSRLAHWVRYTLALLLEA